MLERREVVLKRRVQWIDHRLRRGGVTLIPGRNPADETALCPVMVVTYNEWIRVRREARFL